MTCERCGDPMQWVILGEYALCIVNRHGRRFAPIPPLPGVVRPVVRRVCILLGCNRTALDGAMKCRSHHHVRKTLFGGPTTAQRRKGGRKGRATTFARHHIL